VGILGILYKYAILVCSQLLNLLHIPISDEITYMFNCLLCALCSFRLLQISSFNGKMNALNEVNKLIANVTYNLHKHGQGELDEWLTAEKVAVGKLPFNKCMLLTFSFIMK